VDEILRRSAPQTPFFLVLFVLPLEIADFDRDTARAYGRIRATLEKKGMPIGALDMMIWAHALALGVTLATNNTKEFSRIKGLTVVDWFG